MRKEYDLAKFNLIGNRRLNGLPDIRVFITTGCPEPVSSINQYKRRGLAFIKISLKLIPERLGLLKLDQSSWTLDIRSKLCQLR